MRALIHWRQTLFRLILYGMNLFLAMAVVSLAVNTWLMGSMAIVNV
ncbi:hypothetical protein N9089_01755 [Crocinitomicaceae bacterium]|nr:hypothetical protein [Crocinitomicaceae bacterium]